MANTPEFNDETCREQDEREFDGEYFSGGMYRFLWL